MGLFNRQKPKKKLTSFSEINNESVVDDFSVREKNTCTDPYLQHAWVSVCIDILTRNVARAEFEISKNGKVQKDTQLAKLFRYPNKNLSRFDLWKQTCAWWSLDGEAFWWFGENYSCGLPTEIYILNPRKMQHVVDNGKVTKWVYTEEGCGRPVVILPDEIIHFKDWNPWNTFRGVSPLVSLGLEVEQDLLAAKQNTGLLKEGGVPKGLLKTDQVLTEAEAELLARTWDKKYGRGMKNRVAVLGKGTEYQPLTFSPDVLKLYDMKKWNLYTLLAKYGIPPRVANIQDSKSSLSGTDTDSQHRAFWNYTLIPLLKNFEEHDSFGLFEVLAILGCSVVYGLESYFLNWFDKNPTVSLIFTGYMIFCFICMTAVYYMKRHIDTELLNMELDACKRKGDSLDESDRD